MFPSGVAYVHAPDRKAELPIAHLAGFYGILQVDDYAGYKVLAEKADVRLAFCWSHVRRKFYALAQNNPAPIASEALLHIAVPYQIEDDIRELLPEGVRVLARAHPAADRRSWSLGGVRSYPVISQKTKLAEAIRYALSPWANLCLSLDERHPGVKP